MRMTRAQREQVSYWYHKGIVDTKTLCNRTGLCRSQVWTVRNLIKNRKSLDFKRKSGRPSKLNEVDRRRATQLAAYHREWSALKISKVVNLRGETSVSPRTIQRHLKKCGFFKLLPTIKPMLTKLMKLKRVRWCHEMIRREIDWKKVVFSDESMFQLFRHGKALWGKKRQKRARPKHPPQFMVWGGISYRGNTCLKVINGSVKKEDYMQIMDECLLENSNCLYPDGWIYQQDNAPPHVAVLTKEWFVENQVDVLDWPPGSPDLNPIEMIWAIMKQKLDNIMCSNLDEWKAEVMKVWDELKAETITSLIESMEWRLRECIRVKGETIVYQSKYKRNQ
jgi:hypothetical protein